MTIEKTDIVFFESERLTDEDDGGGRETATIVVDGQSNNLFPDISRLDRVYGRVNLRKVFLRVNNDTRDVYYGAHVILTKAPSDEKVSAVLFQTQNPDDERTAAKDFVESYVTQGTLHTLRLLGNQLYGQRSITAYQQIAERSPGIGDVLCLVQAEGLSNQAMQFVRINSLEYEDRTFIREYVSGDPCNTFVRRVYTIGITSPLAHTFSAGEATCLTTIDTNFAKVRYTTVADAATYYGVTNLAENIELGAMEIKVDSIYQQLVPSSRGEAILADILAGGLVGQKMNSGGEAFTVIGPAHTQSIKVTLANRAYSYVLNCLPIPAVGAVAVHWRVMGKWYSISDTGNGTGALTGDGTGIINYNTGTLQITLQALPDVGTQVLATWATKLHFIDNAGATFGTGGIIVRGDFTQFINRSTAVFTWYSGSTLRTATCARTGVISGAGKGFVAPSGKWWLDVTSHVPDEDSNVLVTYNPTAQHEKVFVGVTPSADGTLTATLEETPAAGSVEASWIVKHGTGTATQTVTKIMGTQSVESCVSVPASTPGATVDPATPIPPGLSTGYRIVSRALASPWGSSGLSGLAYIEATSTQTYPSVQSAKNALGLNVTKYITGSQDKGGSATIEGIAATITGVYLTGIDAAYYAAHRDASATVGALSTTVVSA